ncbi:hypothetical protein K0M31_009320 [Melipona bicolor]|uniref:Uncharacterized protein n=1 Tax=Melipona bicolor TaxID=60889 RepID=A0AA40KJM8_9HYME|nr:hypothetical protein K0M31_009320 [Melipona bicolor]
MAYCIQPPFMNVTFRLAESSDAPPPGFRVLDIKRRSSADPPEGEGGSREPSSSTRHPSRMFVTRPLSDFCPVYAVIRPTTTDLNSHGRKIVRAQYSTRGCFFLTLFPGVIGAEIARGEESTKRDAFNSGCSTPSQINSIPDEIH